MNKSMLSKSIIVTTTAMMFLMVITVSQLIAMEQLYITSILVDFEDEQIIINGHGFDNGRPPIVILGELELTVDSYSENLIAVLFPPEGLDDGDYLLSVTTGNSNRQNDIYNLTVGAAGPAGPQGEPGLIDLSMIYIASCSGSFHCMCHEETDIALSASAICPPTTTGGIIPASLLYIHRAVNSLRQFEAMCDDDAVSGEYPAPSDFDVTCLRVSPNE